MFEFWYKRKFWVQDFLKTFGSEKILGAKKQLFQKWFDSKQNIIWLIKRWCVWQTRNAVMERNAFFMNVCMRQNIVMFLGSVRTDIRTFGASVWLYLMNVSMTMIVLQIAYAILPMGCVIWYLVGETNNAKSQLKCHRKCCQIVFDLPLKVMDFVTSKTWLKKNYKVSGK